MSKHVSRISLMFVVIILSFGTFFGLAQAEEAAAEAPIVPLESPAEPEVFMADPQPLSEPVQEPVQSVEPTLSVPQEEPAVSEEIPAEEIVVTANRRASSWKDAAAMVTVIEKEEIINAPAKTLDEFLVRVPSVSYKRTHIAECGPGREITLRGISEQKRTLILVDGIPMNEVNGAVNWSMIPKESVERIEIVRGPMSALYGSGAMGGVINILTKKPEKPSETVLKGGYGSLNTYSASLLQRGMFDKVGYSVGGHLYHSDGYVQATPKQDYHVKNERTDVSLSGSLYVKPDDKSQVTLGMNYVNEDYSRGLKNTDQKNATTAFRLAYEREMADDASLSAAAFVQKVERNVVLGARPDYTKLDHTEFSDSVKYGQVFQTDFKVADFNQITVGVDSSYFTMDKHNVYFNSDREANAKGNQLLSSIFAQDEMTFKTNKHKFMLTPGFRLDYIRSGDGKSVDTAPGAFDPVDDTYQDRSWVAINPKLAFVYRYDKWTTLRASAGRSFAAPTLFELYTVFTRGPTQLFGNPELKPENAYSAEIGWDQWYLKNMYSRITGYYTFGENFISSRPLNDAGTQTQMANITQIQIMGIDAELHFDINSFLSVYGGYTFNNSTILEDEVDASTEGNMIPFEPMHRARLGVVFQYLQWITADFSTRYEGERYTDLANTKATRLEEYVMLDLTLSGQIVEQVRWSLAFENLLDKKYDVYSVPSETSEAPGLLISGSVTMEF